MINELRRFNPITGVVADTAIGEISGVNIGALAANNDDQLWVGIHAGASSANITVIDSTNDSLVGTPLKLGLNPIKIVFSQTTE